MFRLNGIEIIISRNPPPQSPSASEFPTNAGNIRQCSAGWAGLRLGWAGLGWAGLGWLGWAGLAGLGTDQPRSHLIWETGTRKWSVAQTVATAAAATGDPATAQIMTTVKCKM